MARRRRRRDRRDAPEHRAAAPERREKRAVDKKRETFEAAQQALRRRRRFIGALVLIPLFGQLGCIAGFVPLCQIPPEWWLAVAAALFGSYLGINIRLFMERRRFMRELARG